MLLNILADRIRFALHKTEDHLLAADRKLAADAFSLTSPFLIVAVRFAFVMRLGVDDDVAQIRKMLEDDLGGFFQVGGSLLPLLLDLFQRPKQALNSLLLHPFGFLQQPLNVGSNGGH
jgi:hypothetical protein